jgi:hypothetical protein
MQGSSHCIDIKSFDKICLKHRVAFTQEELKKVVKLFGSGGGETKSQSVNLGSNPRIDFQFMSKKLGLHKHSFNYLVQSTQAQRA